ncbi:hypothetical protein L210DRAFT_3537665 [Boletus edulis BED1]|uniref:Uncharacterized protein n=1 Tax=Boletus edulis BED1 TaxID=1328754 RepID=A0AAD4BWI7_BOLED|nr:hypothetical protein L210DRAFT_3537665 [Boletus edulis BED1]
MNSRRPSCSPNQLFAVASLSPLPHALRTPPTSSVLSGATAEIIDAEHLSIHTVDPSYFWTEPRWREHRNGLGLPVESIEPPHPHGY